LLTVISKQLEDKMQEEEYSDDDDVDNNGPSFGHTIGIKNVGVIPEGQDHAISGSPYQTMNVRVKLEEEI
jgi:hypothetical protein